METAIILCDGYFGSSMGKTANGLVRYSQRFKILGVIDRKHAGRDAGEVLGEGNKKIPVFRDVKDAIKLLDSKPEWLINGVASIGGMLPPEFRPHIKYAIENGIDIICGLHEFLGDDPEFGALAKKHGVRIVDIRKEPPLAKMHAFMNRCRNLPAIRIPVLGTDSSIGKRTTAIILADALSEAGIKAEFVATGQTGILQGSKYGIPLDAIQGDYMVGELENAIVAACESEKPKVVIIEGQGSISHPAYVCGTRAIINASSPSGIIMQHAPGRKIRNYKHDFLKLPMPDPAREIEMLEMSSGSKVIAITINHENMTDAETKKTIREYEDKFGLPVCDVLKDGCGKLVGRIRELYGL
jgi:uncharacterized NAD-dependent epimerase/dehydratase family protein